ncbi:fatty acyl-AMP ligase [Myxococcus stipitatus]|uniref:fatty acyl-AMP ligase n=1 Tax=Myxococcus stipitatus TaxID=83455 RepID=UPI0031453B51
MTAAIPPSITTLSALLRWRAETQPEALAYTFLVNGEDQERQWSYAELDRNTRAIAAALQEQGAAEDRALLLFAPGLDYIGAFYGCLSAGVAAVPVYPPQNEQTLARLLSIIADARPRFALTTSDILESVKAFSETTPVLKELHWIAVDALPSGLEARWKETRLQGEGMAFLQYTSGSTSAPKGVMVSHRNLLANQEMIRQGFGSDQASTIVGWLPLYHDMGLIGTVMQPLYLGGHGVLMSPWAFLQRPVRWLRAISKYRGVVSGGPNFGYALCVRKVKPEQREGLDLSSWKVAFNGAEPVRADTMERFAETFAPQGFQKAALYPCYGLAEATLYASGGMRMASHRTLTVEAGAMERNRVEVAPQGTENARVLVSCGRAWAGGQVRIANPETFQACADDEVGEIWVSGPHVTQGYWGRGEHNAETFQARIQGREEEGGYLRTGDLGFQRDGELYVTGRLKDLIIVDGRNHYPQDIEQTVEVQHEGFRLGCCVAFSVEQSNEEKLVVLIEVDRQYAPPGDSAGARGLEAKEVTRKVRQALAAVHSLDLHELVLLQHGEVLKTSSGKVQRRACRAKYLENSLQRWPG